MGVAVGNMIEPFVNKEFHMFLARIQDVLFTKTNNLGTNKEINV